MPTKGTVLLDRMIGIAKSRTRLCQPAVLLGSVGGDVGVKCYRWQGGLTEIIGFFIGGVESLQSVVLLQSAGLLPTDCFDLTICV